MECGTRTCRNIEIRDEGARRITATVSDESLDRYDSIILQSGWKLERFRNNPVIMPFHDYSAPPVGRALSTWVEPHADPPRLRMRIEFANTDIGREMYQLYSGGFMRAFSVGWIPIAKREMTEKEIERLRQKGARFTGRFTPVVYSESELLEASAVPIPGNPGALADQKSELAALAARADRIAPHFAVQLRSVLDSATAQASVETEIMREVRRVKKNLDRLNSPQVIEREILRLAGEIRSKVEGLKLKPAYSFGKRNEIDEVIRLLERKLYRSRRT